jgi:dipeptidase
MNVCNYYNDFSCITQLRNCLPADIGNIIWIAPRYPCIQPFIPWYYGINKISSKYGTDTYKNAQDDYNIKNINYIEMYPDLACWVFDDFANKIDSCYEKEIKSTSEWKKKFQENIFREMNEKEKELISTYQSNREKALQMITDLTNGCAEKVLAEIKDNLLRIKKIRQ